MRQPATYLLLLLVTLSAGLASAEEKNKPAAAELTTEVERFSYTYGLEVATRLKALDREIDLESLYRGLKDSYEGKKLLLTSQEAVEVRNAFNRQHNAKLKEKSEALARKNLLESGKFIMENRGRAGVVETKSGLQYIVLKKGDGPKPQSSDRVEMHYQGTLLDGREFDNSYKRGKPVVFPVKGDKNLISGWTEAMQLMRVGDKFKLFIPPGLAYGNNQVGPIIEPNSMLIFEVEMVAIAQPENQTPAQPTPKPNP